MKKLNIFILIIIIFSLTSCGLDINKVYILDDSTSDSSVFSDYVKILNINSVTEGWIKGFIHNENNILVARSKDTGFTLSTISIDGLSDEKQIYKSSTPIIPYIELSPIDRKVLAGNVVLDVNGQSSTSLPIFFSRKETNSDYASYSFLNAGYPVNIDFEYIYEMINPLSSNINEEGKKNFDQVITWFFKSKDNTSYLNYKLIVKHALCLTTKKYFFLSSNGSSGNSLWYYDFKLNTEVKLDDNVKTFELSPEGTNEQIAYVVSNDGNDTLINCNLNDTNTKTNKRILTSFPDISGIHFSPSGKWLSLSAGEKKKNDIFLVSSYDSSLIEQLTHGYNSSGKMYWSKDSKRIAFNSFKRENLTQNPDVYTISISIKKEKYIPQGNHPAQPPYLGKNGQPFDADKFYKALFYITNAIINYK